ncbi:MAG TPA: hypothetical protein VMH83_01675 [Candidatus Acidoferrum sp.]|nr:hypothetical protein [Candidatus Acidoferrum sp.]
MFDVNTTLILGAGASHGYGYPLGDELIQKIINSAEKEILLDPSYTGQTNLQVDLKFIQQMAHTLRFYDPVSIDSFLMNYSGNTLFIKAVKMIIAKIILSCSNEKKFERGATYDGGLKEMSNWYRYIWNALVAGVAPKDLADQRMQPNFNIITFNYDSSLEHYLYTRVDSQSSFLTADQKRDFKVKIANSIHHVYGSLLNFTGNEAGAKYEIYFPPNYLTADFLSQCCKNIHLINEREKNYQSLHEIIKKSEQIVFLGFGFDDTNIGESVLNLKDTINTRVSPSGKLLPVVKYTNFGDSALINSKVESFTKPNVPYPHKSSDRVFKSTKRVYQALAEDFSLNTF